MDADERVTDALRGEIEAAMCDAARDGYYIDREFMFMGRSLRCFRPNWNLPRRHGVPILIGSDQFRATPIHEASVMVRPGLTAPL